MTLTDIMKSFVKDFRKGEITNDKLNILLDKVEQGHYFIIKWAKDKKNFRTLKTNPVFHGRINEDKRGWLISHDFPITLEILNKEITPGGKMILRSQGGEEKDLLVYHALCPELENFTSLIVWIDTGTSMQAWQHIVTLIESGDDTKVLQFSQKCGIVLPNKIHPSNDRNSQLVTKDLYESLYDWRFAHYLYDDGMTIMSHESPLNFRQVILDEWTKEESFVDIRTTIGRLISIQHNSIKVSVPCLFGPPKLFEWQISNKHKENLKENHLYFLQIYKITGAENLENHIRDISEASPADIIGMFLADSMYLLYLGKMRMKLVNSNQFERLFCLYYEQVSRFCSRNNDELDTMNHIDWKIIQLGFTNSFTKWIGYDLYIIPPLLRRFLFDFDTEIKETVIQKFDNSLREKNHDCFTKTPYKVNGNKMFSRLEMVKINKIYDFMNFLINEKRFILGIQQNFIQSHQRDEEIQWLLRQL